MDTSKLPIQLALEKEQALNEELASMNEELSAANEELISTNEELKHAREKLAVLNNKLEQKAAARTQALTKSEAEAQALNEELNAVNEELAAANEQLHASNEELFESREALQKSVNELISAKDQVEKSEKLFKSIALNIPKSLIIVIGKDHRFIMIEGDLMAKMGYDSSSYAGKHPVEVAPLERYEASKDLYERVLAGEQFTVERKGPTGDDYRVDFVPLKNNDGEVYAGLIIALEVTDLKKAEERSAKLAAIVESSDDAIIGNAFEIGQCSQSLFRIAVLIGADQDIRGGSAARDTHPLLAGILDQPGSFGRDGKPVRNTWVEMCLLLQVLVGKVAHRPLIVLQLHMLKGFDRPGLIDPRQPVDYCTAEHDIRQSCTLLEHGIPFDRIVRQRFCSCPA